MFGAFLLSMAAYFIAAEYTPLMYSCLLAIVAVLVVLGIVDDLRPLPSRLRFWVYAVLCLAYALLLGTGAQLPLLWLILGVGAAALALLWHMNLYNFMDGIDGIAASQALLVSGLAGLLASSQQMDSSYVVMCFCLAGCHLGFLCWNKPPARMFMGDAGSIPTGFLIAALAILGQLQQPGMLGVWVILTAVFVVDATWTLLRRARRGERLSEAHRNHAYQRLSRHWHSHMKVTALLWILVLGWLAPLAWCALNFPKFQILLVILAYLPLLIGMAKLQKLA